MRRQPKVSRARDASRTVHCSSVAAVCLASILLVCASPAQQAVNQPGSSTDVRTQNLEATAAQDNWLSFHGDSTGRRYSHLVEITRDNVSQMQLQWVFHSRSASVAGAVPIVVGGVMYLATSSDVYAVDARTGAMLWHHSRQNGTNSTEGTPIHTNRGLGVLGNRLYWAADDAHLLCLDARSGNLLWDIAYADANQNYGAPSAPLVVLDKVIVGVSGNGQGARGFIAAFAADDGKEAWRLWTDAAPDDKGALAEPGDSRRRCGGAMWMPGTYDPDENAIYWGAGQFVAPLEGRAQSGDGRNADCVLALDAETGKLKWRSAWMAHERCGNGAPQVPVPVDITNKGSLRKLLIVANGNRAITVFDRETGKVLSESGKACYGAAEAAGGNAPSYSEQTHLFYFLSAHDSGAPSAGESSPGIVRKGMILAYDPAHEGFVWENPVTGTNGASSGLLTTTTGLLLFGDASQSFNAVDAASGKLLWHFNMGQSPSSPPISYSIDGRQYFVVAAGKDIFAFGLP